MIDKIYRHLYLMRSLAKMNIALSRAAATASLREIDAMIPSTWEFSGFSQNGEDGIIDFLSQRINEPNRYFIEIGASDGVENNSSWLAVARRFSGIMIEGNPETSERCRGLIKPLNPAVETKSLFVQKSTLAELRSSVVYTNPDLMSLDIDGIDYYIAKELLEDGYRPKIFIVEYNSAFGPSESITIPYSENFQLENKHIINLYYGCSVTGWRQLFETHGYRFLTVETRGINAFFVDPSAFDSSFLGDIRGINYVENVSHSREYKPGWERQFDLIKDREFLTI